MSRSDYHQVVDGEWVQIIRRGFKEQCCDCGLVHVVDYRINSGTLEFRARRDERATAAARRGFKFEKD